MQELPIIEGLSEIALQLHIIERGVVCPLPEVLLLSLSSTHKCSIQNAHVGKSLQVKEPKSYRKIREIPI